MPYGQHKSTLEDEPLTLLGLPQPVEESLQHEVLQQFTESATAGP